MTGILAGESPLPLLASSLAAGILLGAFADVFRIRRLCSVPSGVCAPEGGSPRTAKLPPAQRLRTICGGILLFCEDVLFFLTAAALFAVLFYRFSWGAPRWYALTAALTGFACYRMTVGRLVMAIMRRVVGYAAAFGRRLFRAIRRFLGLLFRPVGSLVRAAAARVRKSAAKRSCAVPSKGRKQKWKPKKDSKKN